MSGDCIVVFEDAISDAQQLILCIRRAIPKDRKVSVLLFPISNPNFGSADKTFEDRILADLKGDGGKSVSLIVCDRDLSGTPEYRGLSESAVSRVAEVLAIPMCLYARGMKGTVVERAQEWRDRQIVMNFSLGAKSIAQTVVAVYEGFRSLTSKAKAYLGSSTPPKTPSEALARAVSRPEIADRLALYGAGNLSNLADVFEAKRKGRSKDPSVQARRMAKLLGLWLYDSILRFPGILLNKAAAASYLGLEERGFAERSFQSAIGKAAYLGPFAETGPFWWRDRLDEIVQRKGFENGYDMLNSMQPEKKWKRAVCHVDGKPPAGYYCMFLEKPVSDRNSRGNLSWFPAGADLSRLTKSVYDELAPWIGLY